MSLVVEIASWALIISGSFFVVVGGIGVVRMPDFYTRMHASSLTDSVGTFAILMGLMLQFGFTLATAKLAAIALFLFITNPTASYALGHAGLIAGVAGIAEGTPDGDLDDDHGGRAVTPSRGETLDGTPGGSPGSTTGGAGEHADEQKGA